MAHEQRDPSERDDRPTGGPTDRLDRDPAEGGDLPGAGAAAEHASVRPSVTTGEDALDPDEVPEPEVDVETDDVAVDPASLDEGLA